MKKSNIFFDLDGTLLDSRKRLYDLFQELVGQSELSFKEYWSIKRQRVNQHDLLTTKFNYSPDQINHFKELWLTRIEEEERLKQDTPFPFSLSLLEELNKNYNLFVVTNRQSYDKAYKQIGEYKWTKYLQAILVTEHKTTKAELINQSVKHKPKDIIVGDTGEDIMAGKELGLKTFAVLSGILSREVLEEYKPDKIVNYAYEIIE
ncbi:MAG: HAD hydrolase-like protein [Candidatus Caenarcaniphilales bacterium]|nr:HAD hydrolase-like protein [Candidatus Caenarcaniphilales bacterium]